MEILVLKTLEDVLLTALVAEHMIIFSVFLRRRLKIVKRL